MTLSDLWPFRPQPRDREVIAGLRDQVIEIGTHVRFLAADKPVPQPRSPDGRFISKRSIICEQLKQYAKSTTTEQRLRETEAFFAEARKRVRG